MWKLLLGAHLSKRAGMLTTYADALAFTLVLSAVPFFVVAFALTGDLLGSLNPAVYKHTLESILPLGANNMFIGHISDAIQKSWQSGWAKTIGFLFALYSSFSLMNQLVRSLLFIFDDTRKPFEWNLSVFTKTVSLLAVWMFLLLAVTVSSVLSFFVRHNVEFLSSEWKIASNLGLIASLYVAVFATYYLVPSKRPKFREARDGAMVASLGWILCGFVFSDALPRLISLNMVYQALGSVVIILLWSQACAWSLIIGACWMVRFRSRK